MTNNSGANDQVIKILEQLGNVYFQKADYQKAVEKYEQLWALTGDNPSILQNLSLAYLALGRRDKTTFPIYEKAYQANPQNQALALVLVDQFIQQGRSDDDAIRLYRHVLSFQPDNRNVLLKLINSYVQRNDIKGAKTETQRVIAEGNASAELLGFFLRICYRDGDYDTAIAALEKAVVQSGERLYLSHLCRTYLRKELACKAQKIPFRINDNGLRFCLRYLTTCDRFRTLDEAVLFLELKQMLKSNLIPVMQADPMVRAIFNEFNLELTGYCKFNFSGDLIQKMLFSSTASAISTQQEPISDDRMLQSLTGVTGIAVIQLSNYNELAGKFGRKVTTKIASTFSSVCGIQLQKFGLYNAWQTDESVLVFSDQVENLVQALVEILRKMEKYNTVVDEKERIFLHIGLHKSTNPIISDEKGVLALIFAMQFHRASTFEPIPNVKTTEPDKNNRILATAPVYDLLTDQQAFPMLCVGLFRSREVPTGKIIYEIAWRDPLENLKKGLTRKMGRFEILDELSKNEIALSYRGRDSQLNRPVVLKVLGFNPEMTTGERAEAKNIFLKDARALTRLSHPNVVIIYDLASEGDFLYLAREYMEGMNLNEWLNRNQDADLKKFLAICVAVCRGLNYAHRSGIVHGHLSPGNIFIAETGEVKVADIGVRALQQKAVKKSNSLRTDNAYAAPEKLKNATVDVRSDIFSLAAIMYEALTSQPALDPEQMAKNPDYINYATIVLPSSINDLVPEFIDQLLLKALAPDPINRYPSISEFLRDIQTAMTAEMIGVGAGR